MKTAFQVAKLLASGAQDSRPWDMAEAMWYQSASLLTGHSHQILLTDPCVQNEIARVLLANRILVDADIEVKLPGTNRPLMFRRSLYSVRTCYVTFVDFVDHNSTYVYESPLAFMPAVLRCYPSRRNSSVHMRQMNAHNQFHDQNDYDSAKSVTRDLKTLQTYAEYGITTPKIIASGTNFIVRERIFGPRPGHLEDPFYGLSKDSVGEAKNSLEQLRDQLTLFGFIYGAEAHRFLEGHAVLNLVTGGWVIARPLVQSHYTNNYKRLYF